MNDELERALIGQTLEDGWVVGKQHIKRAGATGACHSRGFIASHPDGRKAYVVDLRPILTRDWNEPLDLDRSAGLNWYACLADFDAQVRGFTT